MAASALAFTLSYISTVRWLERTVFSRSFSALSIISTEDSAPSEARLRMEFASRRMVFTFSLIWAVSSIPAANSSLVAELLAHIWSTVSVISCSPFTFPLIKSLALSILCTMVRKFFRIPRTALAIWPISSFLAQSALLLGWCLKFMLAVFCIISTKYVMGTQIKRLTKYPTTIHTHNPANPIPAMT